MIEVLAYSQWKKMGTFCRQIGGSCCSLVVGVVCQGGGASSFLN